MTVEINKKMVLDNSDMKIVINALFENCEQGSDRWEIANLFARTATISSEEVITTKVKNSSDDQLIGLESFDSKLIEKFEITGDDEENIFFEATFYSDYYNKSFTCNFALEKEVRQFYGEFIIYCRRDYLKEELNDQNESFENFEEVVPYDELLTNFGLITEAWSSDSDQYCFIMKQKILHFSSCANKKVLS